MNQGDSMKITQVIKIANVNSTNTYIKNQYHQYDSGTLIWTDHQTNGRGQRGNVWITEPEKDLTFSFYLNTSHNIFSIMLMTTLMLVHTLKTYDINATIKLPNDLYTNKKKIAGILIETIKNESNQHVIIGVGINVNSQNPGNYNDKATSILIEKKQIVSLKHVLQTFIDYWNKNINNDTLYEVFKTHIDISAHEVVYLNNTYELVDITQDFNCVIRKDDKTKYVSCSELTFNYK